MAKILVIDDDAAVLRLAVRILTGAGHEVIEAVDGIEGMHRFHAEAPAMVITDMVMPNQEGVRTIMDIRALGTSTLIIAMSGGGMGSAAAYLDLAEGLGADAILSKPFRAEELVSVVARLLETDTDARLKPG